MKCKVCGADCGRYVLCSDCNKKREAGEVVKCVSCGEWHYANATCSTTANPSGENVSEYVPAPQPTNNANDDSSPYLYNKKASLLTATERKYYDCILKVLPENMTLHMQCNLATFIERSDGARFQNELYRNVDFLITDKAHTPLFVIEVNDNTHKQKSRKERDEKVAKICEEAGIPIMKLWTDYGVNEEYISDKIKEVSFSLPAKRVHHFDPTGKNDKSQKDKKGCYIATCVYGSYDCPEVWVLRRFRDETLLTTSIGNIFVKAYYCISPIVVKYFGGALPFTKLARTALNFMVDKLKLSGYSDTPYQD